MSGLAPTACETKFAMFRPRLVLGLRIAATVLCGIACVLAAELWLRSHWWEDSLNGRITGAWQFELDSFTAGLAAGAFRDGPNYVPGWNCWRVEEEESVRFGFGIGRIEPPEGNGYAIVCPHWFPVLVFVALAVAPWMKWRFSLRSMLIATTLLAVLIGLNAAGR